MTTTPPPLSPEIKEQQFREQAKIASSAHPAAAEYAFRALEAAYRLGASEVQQLREELTGIDLALDGVYTHDSARVRWIKSVREDTQAAEQRCDLWHANCLAENERRLTADVQLAEAHARLREMEQALALVIDKIPATELDSWGVLDALQGAALSPAPAVPPQEGKLEPGELRLSIWYGVGTEHHLSGPMGHYPEGVTDIMRAADKALAESSRLAAGHQEGSRDVR